MKPVILIALASLAAAGAAQAATPPIASLEASLRSHGVYAGPVPAGGPRLLLVSAGQHELGSRPLAAGAQGWDVAELQVALAWHGFPSGPVDGAFGARLTSALERFQRFAAAPVNGVATAATVAALRARPPLPAFPLAWPLLAPTGDRFGPRQDRFHEGVDLPAPTGAPAIAAAAGRVVWAGPRPGGWGNLVTIAHGQGVRTMYAHLSRVDVRVGDVVSGGTVIGLVGATGDATGPHLHFEVRVRGAAVDPLAALVSLR